jgi:hypothetical protein
VKNTKCAIPAALERNLHYDELLCPIGYCYFSLLQRGFCCRRGSSLDSAFRRERLMRNAPGRGAILIRTIPETANLTLFGRPVLRV